MGKGGRKSVSACRQRRPGADQAVNVTKAQTSFTPGSTASKNKKRYLGESSASVNGPWLTVSVQHDRCC
jgi:hypothetical protein